MILKFFTLGVLLFLSVSCSSSKQNTDEKSGDKDVYVFDEIPDEDFYSKDDPNNKLNYYYLVQIGAFASKNNADNFARQSTQILGEELEVSFSNEVKLYVVRLKRSFNTRNEAEKIRNELWQNDNFRDAWIIEKRQ